MGDQYAPSAQIAPDAEEMDRAMTAPPICANLTFGGAVVVQNEVGMFCSPMGMVTLEKCMQACFCPDCVQLSFSYTNGSYTEGLQIDSKPAGCCGKPYFTVSLKDYSTPAGDEAGSVTKAAIKNLRSQGKSDELIAKLYPAKEVVGKSAGRGQGSGGTWGVKMADGSKKFYIKNKPGACKAMCGCPMMDACTKGIAKGRFCMNFKNPIYDESGNKVAYVVQTVPLIPVAPCAADMGPTIAMSIHKAEGAPEFGAADVARLSLFMFMVTPNLSGPGLPKGGPAFFIGKIANMLVVKLGWALGYGQTEVEVEYITVKEALNGEIGGIGDFLDQIRGKKSG